MIQSNIRKDREIIGILSELKSWWEGSAEGQTIFLLIRREIYMGFQQILSFLISSYQTELDYYKELLELSYIQKKLIKEEKMDELLMILNEKDIYISKIDGIEEKLQPYKEGISKGLDLEGENWMEGLLNSKLATPKLKKILMELRKIVQDLYDLDQENQKFIEKSKQELVKRLNKVKIGLKMNKSYNNNDKVRVHSRFIDNKR
ncbi:flagellar export chaperone FlgN [Orenia marismortui]|uniref:FlgN protein n=1 Tax=Orenia marismortui TaxID=46469 RepID=A0A4V3H021_9FIRM|nr:flagellar export chaperone FlgN [Orenia marismortui]TDX58939.1 FlgN protein [Orenia marismortui]